jgi:hypothetical protein
MTSLLCALAPFRDFKSQAHAKAQRQISLSGTLLAKINLERTPELLK